MRQFYIKEGIQFKGPLELEEIKLMKLSRSTLVWFKELPDWTTADAIEELNGFLPANDKQQSPIISYREEKKTIATIIVAVFIIVLLLVMVFGK
jgi:hypothetical protein